MADEISVSQFKFVGYKNVYYEGSDHQVSIVYLPFVVEPYIRISHFCEQFY